LKESYNAGGVIPETHPSKYDGRTEWKPKPALMQRFLKKIR